MMTLAKSFASLTAFACGAIVALAALGASQDVLAAPGSVTVHTCAAADGRLRLTETGVPCLPDERRVRIHVPGQDDPECKADNSRLETLERRLRDLERRSSFGGKRRVNAPFKVITDTGATLLEIDDWEADFYNRAGKNVVSIVTTDTFGGSLHTRSTDGTSTAQLHAGHLRFEDKGQERVHLGLLPDNRYGLMVKNTQGKNVAYLGQARDGSGYAGVADNAGYTKVEMSLNNGAGSLAVWNNEKQAVALFVAGMSTGAGLMQLTNAAGATMVEAGVNPDGAGVVRTGPNMRHSGVGILGLVPSFVIGKP